MMLIVKVNGFKVIFQNGTMIVIIMIKMIIIIKKQNLQIKLYDKFLLIYINYRNKKIDSKNNSFFIFQK
jgi:hypothetical protein